MILTKILLLGNCYFTCKVVKHFYRSFTVNFPDNSQGYYRSRRLWQWAQKVRPESSLALSGWAVVIKLKLSSHILILVWCKRCILGLGIQSYPLLAPSIGYHLMTTAHPDRAKLDFCNRQNGPISTSRLPCVW